jgi:hypothetical protein
MQIGLGDRGSSLKDETAATWNLCNGPEALISAMSSHESSIILSSVRYKAYLTLDAIQKFYWNIWPARDEDLFCVSTKLFDLQTVGEEAVMLCGLKAIAFGVSCLMGKSHVLTDPCSWITFPSGDILAKAG